jgi:hypothetical protein
MTPSGCAFDSSTWQNNERVPPSTVDNVNKLRSRSRKTHASSTPAVVFVCSCGTRFTHCSSAGSGKSLAGSAARHELRKIGGGCRISRANPLDGGARRYEWLVERDGGREDVNEGVTTAHLIVQNICAVRFKHTM